MKQRLSKLQIKLLPVSLIAFVLLVQSSIANADSIQSEINQTKATIANLKDRYVFPTSHSEAKETGETKNSSALRVEKKYLAALRTISQDPSKASITPQFRKQLRGSIKDFDKVSSDISVDETLALLKHIEENKKEWTFEQRPGKYTLHGKDDEPFFVYFELDEDSNLYLEYGDSLIGEGSSKIVHGVTRFEDWERIVRLEPKNPHDPDHVRNFEKEKTILSKIMKLSAKEQIGLVKTFHVGKYIYQEKYDTEFFNVMVKNAKMDGIPVILSFNDHLEVLRQLTPSILKMHQLGICVADIKPENILVKFSNNRKKPISEVVLADFGLSFEPTSLIQAGSSRPSVGSPHYAAPEVAEGHGWLGKDTAQKEKTAFNSDAFAISVVFFTLLHFDDPKGHIPWLGADEWIDQYEKRGQWRNFFSRRDQLNHALVERISKADTSTTLGAIDALLGKALVLDPIGRISFELFHKEMMEILSSAKK